MRAVGQHVAGELLVQGRDRALILRTVQPEPEAADRLFLRFPFVTRGPDDHIFPAVVKDDWGREMCSLKLYGWVREEGDRFPRSEIFGFEQDGRETQVFLREMELRARLPCYVYTSPAAAVTDGVMVDAILLRDPGADDLMPLERPVQLGLPLSAARVSWWALPPEARAVDLDLARLLSQPRRGP